MFVITVPPRKPDAPAALSNISEGTFTYSPFFPISIKLLFQGPTIHYIDTPLSFWTVAYTNISRVMSANAVSIMGVVCACIGGKFILSDSIRVRMLGVVFFKVRIFDSL